MKVLISLLLFVAVAVAQFENRECPANKTYGQYGDCPMSCYLLLPRDQPEPCTMKLNFGCKCQEGFVLLRHKVSNSNCIKPEDCPPASELENV